MNLTFVVIEQNKILLSLSRHTEKLDVNNLKINILLVDKNSEQRDQIKKYLHENNAVSDIRESDSSKDAFYKIFRYSPDLIISDIGILVENGIEFVEFVAKNYPRVGIAICSEKKEYAIEAIKNEIFDFILKPIKKKDLFDVINKYQRKKGKDIKIKVKRLIEKIENDAKIKLNSKYSYVVINPEDIIYCQADGAYTDIHLTNGKVEMVNSYLSNVEKVMAQFGIVRISRSTLINSNLIRKIDRNNHSCLLIAKGEEHEILGSKGRIKALSEKEFY